jgi:GNAT superfamily N-acetyltransferase
LLPAIERAAGELFAGVEPGLDPDDVGDADWYLEAQGRGQLWVAIDEADGGAPVAFALFEDLDGALHLEEADVHPDHARQGLGARLIDAAAAFGRELGYRAITLTTFRHVAWNAPYYERIGFRELSADAWGPGLRERVADETRRGLAPERRVVMARPIGAAREVHEEDER